MDDYAIHILQKHRVAIALAVLKTKPENITIEKHIEQLRSKFSEEEMDSENFNISIDSNDFQLNEIDDFCNAVSQTDIENNGHDQISTKMNDNTETNNQCIQQNEINRARNELNIDQDINDMIMNEEDDLNDSITILENFEHGYKDLNEFNTETDQRNSLTDVMEVLKRIDDGTLIVDKPVSRIDQPKSYQENNIFSQLPLQGDLTQCNSDIDLTECENVNMNKQEILNRDQNSLPVKENLKDNTNALEIAEFSFENKNLTTKISQLSNQNIRHSGSSNIKSNITKDSDTNIKNICSIRNYRHTKKFKNIYQNVANIFDNHNKKEDNFKQNKINTESVSEPTLKETNHHTYKEATNLQKINECKNVPYTSKDLNNYNITIDFTSNTHYSQSQMNIITIDNKLIHGVKRNNSLNNNNIKTEVAICKKRKDDIIIIQDEIINEANFDEIHRQTEVINKLKPEKNKRHTELKEVTNLDKTLDQTKIHSLEVNNEKIINVDTEDDIFAEDLPDNLIPSNTQMYEQNNEDLHVYPKIQDKAYSQNYTIQDNLRILKSNDDFQSSIYNNVNRKTCEETQESCVNFDNTFNAYSFGMNSDNSKHTLIESKRIEDEISYTNFDVNGIDAQKQDTNNSVNKKSNQITTENCTKSEDWPNNTKSNEGYANFDNNLEQDIEIEEEEVQETDVEQVPFKIIEELNKVKIYLNKIERSQRLHSSNDTGYRSDSSAKNSLRTPQSSLSWLDQSAYSLFNYITTCPLTNATEDITREISVTLGQVIDKLHEEEKCPLFLEGMLDSIQNLLGLIYENDCMENVLLQKDEYIHRLIIFNRSIYIQKYTIEKITKHLEKLHTDLTTKDSDYEIKNISRIENACHIFHLLEILLKKHKKKKENLSQNTEYLTQNTQELSQHTQNATQNSQKDEKSLKKSNIMDIWRKKWNTDLKEKENQNEGSFEKNCEITKCCSVLNKLVVECMEGHSLISYFALKCFNVMQN